MRSLKLNIVRMDTLNILNLSALGKVDSTKYLETKFSYLITLKSLDGFYRK